MGGRGSGRRWHYGAADCTEDYRRLDVRRWQRDGFLMPARAFGWQWTQDGETLASIGVTVEAGRVILNYRYRSGGEWNAEEYPIRLDRTPCTYGGTRAWFICPAVGCGRRVAILYMGGRYFACRHCYRLAYESQREAAHSRALHRARKIYARLSGDPNCLDMPDKPKGMHWRTYERLSAEAEAAEALSWVGMAYRLKLWPATIG